MLEAKVMIVDKPRLIAINHQRWWLIKTGTLPNIWPDLEFIRKDLEKELVWRKNTDWQDVEARQVP